MTRKTILAAALCALCVPLAQADNPYSSLDLTSNFVYRGISQTHDNPALQGGMGDQASNGLYAGVWASTMDSSGAHLRGDLRAGIRPDFASGLELNTGVVLHRYDATALNTNESYLRVGIAGISGRWSRDWEHGNDYFSVRDRMGLGSGYKLLLHAGHTSGDTVASYDDVAAGFGKVIDAWHLQALVTDTDHRSLPGAGAHLVLTVARHW